MKFKTAGQYYFVPRGFLGNHMTFNKIAGGEIILS